ncbi:EscU/YscU/HrcU family type III secretion system export apparatus switch protein [Roseobacteraceae bacterium S113]
MADKDESAEKSFEASQRKLDQARQKGDFARSTDINATAMYLGFLVTALAVGGSTLVGLGDTFSAFYSLSHDLSDRIFASRGTEVLAPVIREIVVDLAPFAIFPAVLVALGIFAQRGFVFAGEKLKPKISRISVVENAKNKFGSKGLFEFAKSAVKLTLFSIAVFGYLNYRYNDLILAVLTTPENAVVKMLRYCLEFIGIVFLLSIAIGAIDFLWQRFEHLKNQRMSHKELRDEMKDTEGDPYLKQKRRAKAEEIAMNQMLSDVPDADVIIVNPTHYAVALKWARTKGSAPECVAKGVDEIALRIREIATENKIPIHSDPPTARALHATLEIGQEIQPEHYQAVAAAIRFSDAMRVKAKGRLF